MTNDTPKFPKRLRSHAIGDAGVTSFKSNCPEEWVIHKPSNDYGWDLFIELPIGESIQGLGFFAQLKSSDIPTYIKKNQFISVPLEVSTVNYLLSQPQPSMLSICDTHLPEKPIYWVWIREAIIEIEGKNVDWKNQKSISFRVPTANRLSKDNTDSIVSYIKGVFDDRIINAAITEMVLTPPSEPFRFNITAIENPAKRIRFQKAASILKDMGLVDSLEEDSEEKIHPLKDEDRKLLKEILQTSTLLSNFHDQEAETTLNNISMYIAQTTDGIKARYFNNRGVLDVHLRNKAQAVSNFKIATDLRPNNPKYKSNLLNSEYSLFHSQPKETNAIFPSDFEIRLEHLLEQYPNNATAHRLKAFLISERQGPIAAETYLVDSPAWSQEPLASRTCLAEIYKDRGNNERALTIMEDAEGLGLPLKGPDWSLKGLITLRLAMGDQGIEERTITAGFGPANLDLKHLEHAYKFFEKAIQEYSKIAFPRIAEGTLVNFTSVALMLAKPKEAEEKCIQFLAQHPNNESVRSSLASALIHQGRPSEALIYLKGLYGDHPDNFNHYKNLAIALLSSEEFEALLALIQEQERKGFLNKEEEGISRALAAQSFAEIGEWEDGEKQIQILKGDSSFARNTYVAEAEFIYRKTGDKAQALNIYRKSLEEFPDDVFLLTAACYLLGNPTQENAQEVADFIKKISPQRQLAPEEFIWLLKALLFLNLPEEAGEQLERAVLRYPVNRQLKFFQSMVLMQLGDEESAYQRVQDYLKIEKPYHALVEAAILAKDTGRLDDAIKLFEHSSQKVTEQKELGKIHCQLYALKKAKGATAKEILGHAIKFGETTSGDSEKEVQFFIMVLLSPGGVDADDGEIQHWLKETQQRMDRFVAEHPRHPGFRKFTLDKGLPPASQLQEVFTDVIAMALPYELATVPHRLSARNLNWPLSLRRKFFFGAGSLFDFFNTCTSSKDFAFGIHIMDKDNNLNSEVYVAQSADSACIDITGLLTLAEFDLLELLPRIFHRIYLARGTKHLLEKEFLHSKTPHHLATKINNWRLSHLDKIRVREAKPPQYKVPPQSAVQKSSTLLETSSSVSIDELFGDGIGETILLARKIGKPIFTDESVVRVLLDQQEEIPNFGTIAFLERLKNMHAIPELDIIKLRTQMIEKNFRYISFNSRDLTILIKEIVQTSSNGITSQQLSSHPILGVFLREFGETNVAVSSLFKVAIDWWLEILFDREIPDTYLCECMEVVSSRIAIWRPISGVLGSIEHEAEDRAALIWAGFLWNTYRREEGKAHIAWLGIKACCERIFPKTEKQIFVKFDLLPRKLVEFVKKDQGLTHNQKVTCFALLPFSFPMYELDKFPLENRFRELSTDILNM